MNAIKALAFAVSASVSLATWAAIAAEPVEEAISGWIAQIDAAPNWSAKFDTLDYDSSSDTAVVTGLTVEHKPAGLTLNFEPISFSGYGEPGDGTFRADIISSDGVTITAAGVAGSISDLRFEAIGNVPKDFSAGPAWDPQRPFTSLMRAYSRFVDIELEHGEVGAMSLVAEADGEDVVMSYKDIAIDGWSDGKIASATSGPLTIESVTPEGPFTISVASTAGRDFDYAAMLRVYDPDQYVGGVGDGIWRNAAAFFEYQGITFDGPDARVTLASAGIENFRVRQPERSFTEFFDRAMLDPHSNQEPTPEEFRAIFAYLSSYSVGAMTFRELKVDSNDGSTGKLGGISILDFSSDGIDEFSVEDFAATMPDEGFVNVARIAFGGVVFPPMEAFIEAMEAEEAGTEFDFNKVTGQIAFFEALGIDVDVPDSPRFKLDKARLDLGNYVGAIPTLLALDIAGADLPADAIEDPRLRSMWLALGYDRVLADFSANLAWNEPEQSVAIEDLRLSVDDVGAVSLNALLAGLTREALLDVDRLPDALIGMSFVGGSLVLEDYPVLDRWIDQQAVATGQEPAQLRQQIAVLLTALTANIGNSGLRDQLQRVLAASVMIPGSITATAMPTAPVPLAALAVLAQEAPANLPDLLGISIERSSATSP